MIPRAEIDLAIDIDGLRAVGPDTIVDGVSCIRGYLPGLYAAATWHEAAELLETETHAIARLDARVVDDLDEAFYEEEVDLFLELELGVNAVVLALCASGCPTFASCRGHTDDDSRSSHPWVLFAADVDRAAVVAEAARHAGCGLSVDDRGLLVAVAPSVFESTALARALIERRARFEALGEPFARENAVPDPDAAADW